MGKTNFTPFSNMEAASFCSQMAIILKSGISSIEGITIMLEDAQHEDEKQLLTQMQETLQLNKLYCKPVRCTNLWRIQMFFLLIY